MDKNTFDSLKKSISEERLAVYRADGVDDSTAIARNCVCGFLGI